jgi:hypothetical protein
MRLTTLNTAIALLLIMLSTAAQTETFPPQELVGTWTGTTEIFGPFKAEPYPSKAPEDHPTVTVTIHTNGIVTGGIGDAAFKRAIVRKNRGALGRKLNIKSDYIVTEGVLQGKVTPRDKGTDSPFTIPFDIIDNQLQGTIMLIPKFPLTRPMYLTKEIK